MHFLGSCLQPEQYFSAIFFNFCSPRDSMILVEHFIDCTPLASLPRGQISHHNKREEKKVMIHFSARNIFPSPLERYGGGRGRGNCPRKFSFLPPSSPITMPEEQEIKEKEGRGGKLLLPAAPLTKSSGTTLRRPKKEKKCCYNNNIIPFVWEKKVRTFFPALFPATSQLSKKQEKYVIS